MTLVVREQVIAAVGAVLESLDYADLMVERNRMDEWPSVFPAIIYRAQAQDTEYTDSASKRHLMEIEIECFDQAATGAALESALNEHYGRITAALLADVTLGGLAQDIQETGMTPNYDRDSNLKPTGGMLLSFTIEFYTAHADPYQTAP